MLLNALPVALVSESFGYLTERLALDSMVVQLIVGLNDWIYGRIQDVKDSVVGAARYLWGSLPAMSAGRLQRLHSHHTPTD